MKNIKALTILLIVSILALSLTACNPDGNSPAKVDYSIDNSYEVELVNEDGTLTYSPKGVECEYGMVFYVGTALPTESYAYLGEALAKQGYIVVIPQFGKMSFAYAMYEETEAAFENHPSVKFFIGGHSQGGGAAVRRAQENLDTVQGAVLLAPLCYSQTVTDAEGNKSSVPDSLKGSSMPTLFVEATEDHVLTEDMKADSKTRLPEGYTRKIIQGGCHMSFSTSDSETVLSFFGDGPLVNITRDEQRALTVEYTLEFLKATVTAKQ